MSCNNSILNSFTLDCNDNQGGVAEIKVRAFSSTLVSGGLATVTSGGITFAGAGLNDWYLFECAQETSSFSDDGATVRTTGTTTYNHICNYVNNKLKQSFRNTLNNLHGMLVHVAVKTNGGQELLLGYERGLIVSASTSGSGTAYTDRNGYSVTFSGVEKDKALHITNYDQL